MFDAVGSVSSIGFSPIDYLSLWSTESKSTSTSVWSQVQDSAAGKMAQSARAASTSAAMAQTTATVSEDTEVETEAAATTTVTAADEETTETTDSTLEETLELSQLARQNLQILAQGARQLATAGAYVQGGASYTYEVGPDGQLYATAVSVSLDTSPVAGDPEATIAKMQQVRAAALASTTPSGDDFAVAATAARNEMLARAELAQESLAGRYTSATGTGQSTQVGMLLNAVA